MMSGVLVAFGLAILPAVLTPGVSLTLAVTRSLAGQPRTATWVVLGTAAGIYCHCLLATAGLSALILGSAEAFTVLKLVGGGYLVVSGALALRPHRQHAATAPRRLPWAELPTCPQAFLGNVLNPKAALLYLAVAPAILPAHDVTVPAMLALATMHVVIMATWTAFWALLARQGRRRINVPSLRRSMDLVGGWVLVGLGVRTIATSR